MAGMAKPPEPSSCVFGLPPETAGPEETKALKISGCPEVEIAFDLSAARDFINKFECGGEGFFYI